MASNISGAVSSGLRNRFFIIRHGLAESNVKGVLVSDPANGVDGYGLTDEGKEQAKQAAVQFRSLLSDKEINKIQLVSSDFLRTRQTAEILHSELQLKRPIKFEPRIRERGLGSLELTPVTNVHDMWKSDELDPTSAINGVESVSSMTLRLTRVIKDYDAEYEDLVIVLVSHGDPCQCIHSFFIGLPPNEFRASNRMYGNCEIRELIDK